MKKTAAKKMFKIALDDYGDEADWVDDRPKFKDVGHADFLGEYCWVVFASGFRNVVVEDKFPGIEKAFKGFDPDGLSRLRQVRLDRFPIKNKRKIDSFLKGARMIAEEGYDEFKKRLKRDGLDMLEELPGIGKVTKFHLAKSVRLADVAKPDIWLQRCAEACSAEVPELASYLASEFNMKKSKVDSVLFNYCKDHQKIPK